MKKSLFIFHITLTSMTIFTTLLSMHPKRRRTTQRMPTKTKLQIKSSPKLLSPKQYKEIALKAKQYNSKHFIFPSELFLLIFSHFYTEEDCEKKSLENNITFLMKMSMVCEKFKHLLSFEAIGKFCSHYSLDSKNQVIENILMSTYLNLATIKKQRLPILILVCAGCDPNVKNNALLYRGISYHDPQMTKTLVEHKANPNTIHHTSKQPLFFLAKTPEMAQILINAGANVNTLSGNWQFPSILWYLLHNSYPCSLIRFYLNNGAKIELHPLDQSCVLHKLIRNAFQHNCLSSNCLKKSELLLKNMPQGMINTLNGGQTPLDVAIQFFRKKQLSSLKQLIALLKKYGGLTALQFAKQRLLVRK